MQAAHGTGFSPQPHRSRHPSGYFAPGALLRPWLQQCLQHPSTTRLLYLLCCNRSHLFHSPIPILGLQHTGQQPFHPSVCTSGC